jgi:hypothetical protein
MRMVAKYPKIKAVFLALFFFYYLLKQEFSLFSSRFSFFHFLSQTGIWDVASSSLES